MNEIRFSMWELINIKINYKFLVNSWCIGGINFRQMNLVLIPLLLLLFFFLNRQNKILLSFFL